MKTSDNQSNFQEGLFRSRSGVFLGVCKGLANWTNIPVGWVRASFVILALLGSMFPVFIAYVILAIVMRPEPVIAFRSEEEAEFYNTHGGSRLSALQRMQSIMKRLETRVQRLEDAVTDPEKDWDRRFRNI